jgi:hypothetical protein
MIPADDGDLGTDKSELVNLSTVNSLISSLPLKNATLITPSPDYQSNYYNGDKSLKTI